MAEENHHLSKYLNEILPTLSLDPETYIPYITGCLNTFEDDEELDEIIGLLQASSETHSDDEEIWPKLKDEILSKHNEYKAKIQQQKQMDLEAQKKITEMKKKEDMEEAMREKERQRLAEEEKAKQKVIDPSKKALLDQYAYDTSERYDNDGNIIEEGSGAGSGAGKSKGKGKVGEETAGGNSNRAIAEKMNKERAQQLRGAQNTSKKDERAKTKAAKLNKMKQKEERRNRATKGERKR